MFWLLWGCGGGDGERNAPRAGTRSPAQAGAGAGGAGSPALAGAGAGGGPGLDAGPSGGAGPFDAGSDPDRNAVTPGTICSRMAEIQCEAERVCCDASRRDKASCLTAFEMSCTADLMADRIAARPEAAFDAAQTEVVFGEIERLASSCDPSVAAFGESAAGLRSMFTGTIAASGDCTPALVFDQVQAGAALVACLDPDRQACLPSLVEWRCAPIATEGGACFVDTNCKPGLYCNNPQLNIAGAQCMARRKNGATCTFDTECQSSFCVSGACVPAERQVVFCPR